MKKNKLTDKKLAFINRIINDIFPFFLFIMGIGVGYLLTPGLDLEKAYSQISNAFSSSFLFLGLMMFCYLLITVERIFLILRGKENEGESDKIKINDKDLFIVDEVSLHYDEKSDSK